MIFQEKTSEKKTSCHDKLHVSSFHYINCLNACATIIVPVSEIKSYGRVPSFYSKIVNQRTLHAVSLEYSIKSDVFFALRKLNLVKLDRWSLALLPTHLPYQNGYTKIIK